MTHVTPDNRTIHLTKHHGAGNDFLVLVDLDRTVPVDGAMVVALCHRRYGIGADGFIRLGDGGGAADVAMELWNADGSPAEMSGNGIRCLAQAAVVAGLVAPPTFTVSTAAGTRAVEYRPGPSPGSATATVDMGPAVLGPDQPQQFEERRARQVDMGNPHLVLWGPDPDAVDVAGLGSHLQSVHAGGINVEFIAAGPRPDTIKLRVWERGAGETLACGTGSAAAAAAAHSWGMVGEEVDVVNPGGTLRVTLRPDSVLLGGPVQQVAEVSVAVDNVLGAARA